MDLFSNSLEESPLDDVKQHLTQLDGLRETAASAVRNAIDYTLNGSNTGRYSVEELNKTEKTLVGVLFESQMRREFGFPDGETSDIAIAGHDVEVKFSLNEFGWMFGPENFGELCLVAFASEADEVYRFGLIRPVEDYLRSGINRDKKAQLLAEDRDKIDWIIEAGDLPRNILYHMNPEKRDAIMSVEKGTPRIRKLFELHQCEIIDHTCIRTVGYDLSDPIRRVRRGSSSARSHVKKQSLVLLGSDGSKEEAHALGYEIGKEQYVCVPEKEFHEKDVGLPDWYKEN
ncbi:hypothetical protein GGP53_001021 [Salinibacter ruber]|uniref:NaeI family type II restriction endonuclease n=1 Tax=Salinibacter ruber TaxID=146919 RepID=UPI002168A75F|nr:NaeI family type II restriction endonuclease [Salinibacter ruber]MCS3627180.1 hypothetical protein [Salinibacter ruber]MCS4144087.1 hypothetical protein [Salinibacter ruber]